MKILNEEAMKELIMTVSVYIDAGIDFVPIVVHSQGQKAALNMMAEKSLVTLQQICAEESTGADDDIEFELEIDISDDPLSLANAQRKEALQ